MKQDTIMHNQLVQLFEYAEMLNRLNSVLELLDPQNGYIGEMTVKNEIDSLKKTILKEMKIHLNNSGISDRAMTIINNLHICPRAFNTED